MSHVGVQNAKTLTRSNHMTTDLKTNHDAEINTSDVEKIQNHCNQNFQYEANNMELDKEDNQ